MTNASARVGLAELSLAIGGFAIGTGEFVAMGLLPNLANQFQVSIPAAGHSISAYALGVVVGAPVIAIAAARWARHKLLLALMAFFAIGNIATALVTHFPSLIAIRFATGLPHGAYFGVASLVVASLAPSNGRAKAIGRMMLGLTGATLAGVPLATWLGQHFGWRAAFVLVAAIAALTGLLILRFVPRSPGDQTASSLRELSAFRSEQVWFTLGVGAIGFGGVFCVISYIAPTLTHVTGLPSHCVPLALAAFGVGTISGNLFGSWLADRALKPTIAAVLAWNAVVLAFFSVGVHYSWLAYFVVFLVGTGVALVSPLQTRLMDVAKCAQTLAAAMNHAAFNVANALGAWLGGAVISGGLGFAATGWAGALLAVGGLLIFAASMARERGRPVGDSPISPDPGQHRAASVTAQSRLHR